LPSQGLDWSQFVFAEVGKVQDAEGFSGRINRSVAARLADELTYACSQMSKSDWLHLVACGFTRATATTLKSKVIALVDLGKRIGMTFIRYRNDGVVRSLQEDSAVLLSFMKALPSKTQESMRTFLKLSRETQREEIVDLLLTWIIMVAMPRVWC
jgi:hypothetical protein